MSTQITPPKIPRVRRRAIVGVSNVERSSQPSGDLEIPPPPCENERALRDEEQVVRVERLMLQGVTHSRELMALLEITDRRKLVRYRERVRTRWRRDCSWPDIEEQRGKALREYELLWQKGWEEYNHASTSKQRAEALKILLAIRIKKDLFQGFTSRFAESRINDSSAQVPENVLRSMQKQEELVEVLKVFGTFCAEEQARVDQGLEPSARIPNSLDENRREEEG